MSVYTSVTLLLLLLVLLFLFLFLLLSLLFLLLLEIFELAGAFCREQPGHVLRVRPLVIFKEVVAFKVLDIIVLEITQRVMVLL